MVLGAVLAATILVLKPVEILKEPPKDKALDATKIYYFEGRKEYTAGQRWRFKRDSLVLQENSVRVNEDELNTWVESVYPKLPIESKSAKAKAKTPAKAAPGKATQPKKEEAPQPFIQTGSPNFRLTSDSLRIGVVYYVDVFGYASFEVVAQCDGTFETPKDDTEPIYFKPSTFYIGSLPVHKLLMLKGLVLDQVFKTFEFPSDVAEAWTKLSEAKVENRELVLVMPAGTANKPAP